MKFNSKAYDKVYPRKDEKPKTDSAVDNFEDEDEIEEVEDVNEDEDEAEEDE